MALNDSKLTVRAGNPLVIVDEMVGSAGLPGAHDYSVFGLNVRSSLPLPELFPADAGQSLDVTITTGPLIYSDATTPPGLTAADGAIVLFIPEVGRFTISGGSHILVESVANAPNRDLRLYLLGSAFGALLHQRGLLPLHANAIEIDGRAVAFMGESGAGKSTLAAWFHDRGHRIVADDVCAVHFDGHNRPFALPGLPRFRLWLQALEASGRSMDGLIRSYADDDWDKFDVPVGVETAVSNKLPLAMIYVLERSNQLEFRRLEGLMAADAVISHTYRGAYVAAAQKQQSHWDACVYLARHIPIYRVARPWSLDRLDDFSEQILEHTMAQLSDAGLG